MTNEVTVVSDDTETLPYVVSVVAQGSTVEGGLAQWVVTLDKPAPYDLTVPTILSGTEYSRERYAAPAAQFPAGTTDAIVGLIVNDDTEVEADKTLSLFVCLPNEHLSGANPDVSVYCAEAQLPSYRLEDEQPNPIEGSDRYLNVTLQLPEPAVGEEAFETAFYANGVLQAEQGKPWSIIMRVTDGSTEVTYGLLVPHDFTGEACVEALIAPEATRVCRLYGEGNQP